MPIVGRNRKARPTDVVKAYREKPAHPKPRQGETFRQFFERLSVGHPEGCHDLLRNAPADHVIDM